MPVSFKDLGLDESILNAVIDLGFEQPTIIQEKAISALLSQKQDLVGLAQTGTGKTAAFGLPLLHLVDENSKRVQGLILSPTRELCVQIADDLTRFSKYKKVKNVAIYGGASIDKQIQTIKKGVQIVVATPGRLADLIKRNALDLSEVEICILDEADEMLNMGFKDELDFILRQTPNEKQTWLFSATMPAEVRRIASSYMTDPMEISSGKANKTNENIEHQYVFVNHKVRYEALKRVIDFNPDIFGVVFCRTKIETQEVADKLTRDGYNSDALHGDLSQGQRDRVMAKFRDKTLAILVATDVAARGIDVNNVTHVIHYQLADEIENYTHRSGRTARAGKTGISIALIGPKDKYKINQLEKITGAKFTELPAPSATEICEKKLLTFGKELKETAVDGSMDAYIGKMYEMFADDSKEDIIKKIATIQMKQLLEYYEDKKEMSSSRGEEPRDSANFDRYFVNLGKLDDLTVKDLRELMGEHLGLEINDMGTVEIKDSFSFFEFKKGNVEMVEGVSDKMEYNGRTIRVELTKDKPRDRSGSSRGPRSDSRSGGGRFGSDRGGRSFENRGGGENRGERRRSESGGDFQPRSNSDRNDRGGNRRDDRSSSDRPRRDFNAGSDRPRRDSSSSDRPARDFNSSSDRPRRDSNSSDRPARDFNSTSDRPRRDSSSSDRPARDFNSSSDRPRRDSGSSDRPKRDFNASSDKPKKNVGGRNMILQDSSLTY